jgi:hypothetical protein
MKGEILFRHTNPVWGDAISLSICNPRYIKFFRDCSATVVGHSNQSVPSRLRKPSRHPPLGNSLNRTAALLRTVPNNPWYIVFLSNSHLKAFALYDLRRNSRL